MQNIALTPGTEAAARRVISYLPCDAAATIRALAAKYHVAYTETPADVLAHHITRLSGDEVQLDETELLLLALRRAGHIDGLDAVRLLAAYLHRPTR
jgi:hypothetical protein